MDAGIVLLFKSAIRGFHVYRQFWKPLLAEELSCSHEAENAFDIFAIKVCTDNGQTVGHLPMEISRITKFLIDRGASVSAILTSPKYRRSPLVQVGLEIAGELTVKLPSTMLNYKLATRYESLFHELYSEPVNEIILGSLDLLVDDVSRPVAEPNGSKRRHESQPKNPVKAKALCKTVDIRSFFQKKM